MQGLTLWWEHQVGQIWDTWMCGILMRKLLHAVAHLSLSTSQMTEEDTISKTKSISDCFRKLIFVISFFVKFLFWPLLFWLPVNFLLLVCYVPNEEEYMTLVYAYWRLNDRPTSHLGKFPTAISAMGYPIQLMFGTRKVFLVLADETLLPFGRIQDGTWPRCHL